MNNFSLRVVFREKYGKCKNANFTYPISHCIIFRVDYAYHLWMRCFTIDAKHGRLVYRNATQAARTHARNLSKCSWDARQHQFNFVRKLSWSIAIVISAKIHSKCASQPRIAKNSTQTHILGVQGRSRSSMLVPTESSSAVLVMIRSKSVSICNHSRANL